MTPRASSSTLGWLVRETFQQARATRIFWVMIAVTGFCIVSCLGTRIEGGKSLRPDGEIELVGGDHKPLTGPNPSPGRLILGFGLVKVPLFRDGDDEVHFLHVLLAKWVAGAAGTLLALVWTAGFLPEFLQPESAAVLLAKPVPRWSLLIGKCLGVLAFLTFQAALFFGGTWVALGVSTGVWLPGYLLGLPLLILNFAIIYGASAVLAVCTRNTATCVFGSLVFWLVAFGMNYGRHATVALPKLASESVASPASRRVVEAFYWVMPKPADLSLLLDRALEAGQHFRPQPALAAAEQLASFSPWLSVLSSLAFAGALLAIAARQFAATDY